MTELFGSFRPFAAALACTAALIAVAPWIPNSDVGAIAAIVSIFVGLPVSILLYRDGLRANQGVGRAEGRKWAVLVFPLRLLGGISLLSGVAILAWVGYNVFIERQREFTGVKSYSQLALPVLLISFGWSWLRRPLESSEDGARHPR
jgi:hypothetical protein